MIFSAAVISTVSAAKQAHYCHENDIELPKVEVKQEEKDCSYSKLALVFLFGLML